MKEIFKKINRTAQENIEKAFGMIEAINLMNGTQYEMLNRRVVYKDDCGHYHDAWTNA